MIVLGGLGQPPRDFSAGNDSCFQQHAECVWCIDLDFPVHHGAVWQTTSSAELPDRDVRYATDDGGEASRRKHSLVDLCVYAVAWHVRVLAVSRGNGWQVAVSRF